MFKDTQKELERLEAELLEQEPEQWDEEDPLLDDDDDFGQETPEVYRNFSNRYKAYNADHTDWDPEDLGEELEKPRRSGVLGLCFLALALIAGVIALLAWWYYGGGL